MKIKEMKSKIEEIINDLLEGFEEDYVLKKLELRTGGRNSLLRIRVDKKEGISIDECAKISKELSVKLDVADIIRGPYRLEVSSPGIEGEEND